MNNSKVVKRKVNASGAKIEPPKKALKKNELLEQFTALQEEFNTIKEENRILLEKQKRFDSIETENRELIENQKKHLEAINLLEETVTVLQNKKIDTEKDVYICGECEYLADCVHDFNEHTHSQDDMEIEENLNSIVDFVMKLLKH